MDGTRPRPYDLRHSFATELVTLTGDEKGAGDLLLHSEKSHLTGRYVVGSVAPRTLSWLRGSMRRDRDGWQSRLAVRQTNRSKLRKLE